MRDFFNKPDIGILFFRVVMGSLLAVYGIHAFMGGTHNLYLMGKNMYTIGITFSPFIWGALAALIYTIGGFLLVLGIFFRPVCFLLLCIMGIALSSQISNGLNLFTTIGFTASLTGIFLSFLFIGPGKHSLKKS